MRRWIILALATRPAAVSTADLPNIAFVYPPRAARADLCVGACFEFSADWASGGPATTLPGTEHNVSVRKLEAVYYPPDGRTYAYVDIVGFDNPHYPASYSTEVGVYSSSDGKTGWKYHGIVIPRGPAGGWDGGGIASPGAAVTEDGHVIVGYAAENSPSGGINRGIGVAIAEHPLGPFVKSATPVADPHGVCGDNGRCDDVIMQSRPGARREPNPRCRALPADRQILDVALHSQVARSISTIL
jgi:hypothetical protein